jgi:hypothetical protein
MPTPGGDVSKVTLVVLGARADVRDLSGVLLDDVGVPLRAPARASPASAALPATTASTASAVAAATASVSLLVDGRVHSTQLVPLAAPVRAHVLYRKPALTLFGGARRCFDSSTCRRVRTRSRCQSTATSTR